MEKFVNWIGIFASVLTAALLFFKIEDQPSLSARDFMYGSLCLFIAGLWIAALILSKRISDSQLFEVKNKLVELEAHNNRLKAQVRTVSAILKITLFHTRLISPNADEYEIQEKTNIKVSSLNQLDKIMEDLNSPTINV